MLAAGGFAPNSRIDGREKHVALDPAMNVGDDEAGRRRQRLGVDVRAPSDDDRVGAAA